MLPCLKLCFLGSSKLLKIPKFNFSVQLNQIPVCICHTFFSHLLIDIQAASRSFLLWIGQPWTWKDGYLCGSVREITCLPSKESLQRLRIQSQPPTEDFVNLCQIWLQLNDLNRDRSWQVLLLRQIGDLHSKDITYCQNYFKYGNIVLFHVEKIKDHFAHLTELCFPWWESTGDLMAD